MAPRQNTHWEELNFLCRSEEWEKALKLANKVSQESKDEEVLQCRVVCTIRLARYEDALAMLSKNKQIPNSLLFEKAYCEYRLDRLKEALNTIRQSQEERANELLAQILYKMEDYEECVTVYEKLINNDDEYQDEHETNLWAAKASLSIWQNKDLEPIEIKSVTYEKLFNKACVLIGQKDYAAALLELKKAHDLCVKIHEEDSDLTAEDLENELAIIQVQKAYVYQKLGRNAESLDIYNQIAKQKSSDITLMAVTNNNIVTLNKDQNLFDSKKRMKLASSGTSLQRLVTMQRNSILFNDALLLYHSGLMDGCLQKITELGKKMSTCKYDSILINVGMLLREKNTTKAMQLLELEMKNSIEDHSNLVLSLAMAQLLLNTDKTFDAANLILKNLKKYNYLALVSLLVSIYSAQNDKKMAAKVLEDAVKDAQPGSLQKEILDKASATFHLHNGNPKKAAEILDNLRKSDGKNPKLIAQLILAYSAFDPKQALQISSEYAKMDKKFANEDMNALELSSNWSTAKYIKKIGKTTSSQPLTKKTVVGPIKKKKKKKLTKNFDPNIAPDLERWLPLRERSYYRGRRKNKKRDFVKGTQGAIPSVSFNDSENSAVAAAQPVGPRLQKHAVVNTAAKPKQKKKKGSKW